MNDNVPNKFDIFILILLILIGHTLSGGAT